MAKRRRNSDAEEAAREHLNGGDDDGDNIHRDDPDYGEDEGSAPLNSAARAEIIRESHLTISDFERVGEQLDWVKATEGVTATVHVVSHPSRTADADAAF